MKSTSRQYDDILSSNETISGETLGLSSLDTSLLAPEKFTWSSCLIRETGPLLGTAHGSTPSLLPDRPACNTLVV